MELFLPDLQATMRLGAVMADRLAASPVPTPIFFYGGLGAGKTTLISSLVKNLRGGDEAETSSPSFTLCNIYATTPPVAHFDLYRQENETADESLLDFLDGERHLVLVEWAERLPAYALPQDRIACRIAVEGLGRVLRLETFGAKAALFTAALRDALRPKQ